MERTPTRKKTYKYYFDWFSHWWFLIYVKKLFHHYFIVLFNLSLSTILLHAHFWLCRAVQRLLRYCLGCSCWSDSGWDAPPLSFDLCYWELTLECSHFCVPALEILNEVDYRWSVWSESFKYFLGVSENLQSIGHFFMQLFSSFLGERAYRIKHCWEFVLGFQSHFYWCDHGADSKL